MTGFQNGDLIKLFKKVMFVEFDESLKNTMKMYDMLYNEVEK